MIGPLAYTAAGPRPSILKEPGLRDYLCIVARAWKIIAVLVGATLLLALAYAFLAPPRYTANAIVALNPPERNTETAHGEQEDLDLAGTGTAQSQPEIEWLHSRELVGEVVDRLHLHIDAEALHWPLIGAAWARLTGSAASEHIAVSAFEVPRTLYTEDFTLEAREDSAYTLTDPDGHGVLNGKVGNDEKATLHGNAGEVMIHVDSLSGAPGTRFRIARKSRLGTILAIQTNTLVVKEKGHETGVLEIDYEDGDPARAAQFVNLLTERYLERVRVRNSEQASVQLGFVESELPKLKERVDTAEAAVNAYRQEHGTLDLSLATQDLLRRQSELEQRQLDLQQQEQALSQRYTGEHPSLGAIRGQILEVRGAQEDLDKKIRAVPPMEQPQVDLARDVQSAAGLYQALLKTANRLRVVQQSPVVAAHVIDAAAIPEMPSSPNRLLVVAAGLLLGLMAGVGVAFTRAHLDEGVTDAVLIERTLAVEVSARVRRGNLRSASALMDEHDVAWNGIYDLYARLHASHGADRPALITVSGMTPGDGASFVAGHLAAAYARAGHRTLLICTEIPDTQSARFKVPAQPGFHEWQRGRPLEQCVHGTHFAHLQVMPTGARAADLPDKTFEEEIKALTTRYERVVIDSAYPLAPVLGACADDNMLVARGGHHDITAIERAAQRMSRPQIHLTGMVLNAGGTGRR